MITKFPRSKTSNHPEKTPPKFRKIALSLRHWAPTYLADNLRFTRDEEFRGRRPSHLEQFTSHSANCSYSLPSDVRSTSEGPPVWLIDSASEDYLWRAIQIHSSILLIGQMIPFDAHISNHSRAVERVVKILGFYKFFYKKTSKTFLKSP